MDRSLLLRLYEVMYRIRLVEEVVADLYRKGEIKHRFVHFHDGEEAVAAGVITALRDTDIVLSHHRAHAHYIAKGGDLTGFFAELLGREGCSGGWGGSMHLVDLSVNYYGSTSIVGDVIGVGTGVAMGEKIKRSGRIVAVFFGDGATQEGIFYESLNVAALYGLPILYVVENNQYADHTPLIESRANPVIAEVAEALGVRSYRVFGNDAVRVYEVASEAVKYVREGEPALIEAVTTRYRGHIGADTDYHVKYRKHVVSMWKELDPLNIMKLYLKDEDTSGIEEAVRREVFCALEKARRMPVPG